MKKQICLITLLLMLVTILCGCQCDHSFKKATCTKAQICTKCGQTQGKALGHKYLAATCDKPQTCERCNRIQGKELGHTWIDADCTTPKTCDTCHKQIGEPLGHDFEKATCKAPKTCKNCKITEGSKGEHSYKDYICEHCGIEDKKGKKTNPLYSFVEKQYVAHYSDSTYNYTIMISFDTPMGNGFSDGVLGSAGYNDWNYELTSSEIIVYEYGAIIGRFTLNEDGSIYCTYSNADGIVSGLTYY